MPKTASDADLKKAYDKLSLKVHPDKNKTPIERKLRANDAMVKVNRAIGVLSDPQERRQYDENRIQVELLRS